MVLRSVTLRGDAFVQLGLASERDGLEGRTDVIVFESVHDQVHSRSKHLP